jgi:uncharacterized membrane protein YqjE
MATADRPISMVLNDIVGNVQDIVHSEMRLAKTELGEELGKSRSAAILVAAGGLLLAFSVLFVLLAVFYALSVVVTIWLAALIVAAAVAAIAAICIRAGIARFRKVRAIPKTAASVKETVEWAKQQTK